jgi:hypothetical protein
MTTPRPLPPPPLLDPQIQKQKDLEEEMVQMGRDLYLSRIQKAQEKHRESTTDYGTQLMNSWVIPMITKIEGFMEKARKPGSGRRHSSLPLVSLLKPHVAAYLTCKVVLDCLTTGNRLQRVAIQIASVLEDELRFGRFQKEQPLLYKKVKEDFQTNHYGYRKKVLVNVMNRYGVEWEGWAIKDKAQLGFLMLDLLIDASGGSYPGGRQEGREEEERPVRPGLRGPGEAHCPDGQPVCRPHASVHPHGHPSQALGLLQGRWVPLRGTLQASPREGPWSCLQALPGAVGPAGGSTPAGVLLSQCPPGDSLADQRRGLRRV